MRGALKWLVFSIVALAAAVVALVVYVRVTGLRASVKPSAMEASAARAIRGLAIPSEVRRRANPIAPSDEAIVGALEHYADHCAFCHANDGSGTTDFGRNLFPPPPDLRAAPTQTMTDGELFYVIENGVRFTGMPAFATGTAAGEQESWKLVHFIRHLPRLTEAEREQMEARNPRSPLEIRQEIEEERFLRGEDPVR
jgi:mono/diheme cytochrome c family protein